MNKIPFFSTKKLPSLKATIHKFGGPWLGIAKVQWSSGSTWLFYFLRKTYVLLEKK